ncbi:MAG: glutathione S-transferase N-terminal domain-containing protein [Gammaproteobacteria bacterium]|nr:glutathione S-transferase N-terminal domain-containing protein [Gammaproteobacteria bacterium]
MRPGRDIRAVLARRAAMTLFSDARCHYSHRVRIVLAEKGVSAEVIDVDGRDYPPALAEINPYSSLPTLVDRDLVLYQPGIMMEYLDERFPHPPLLPVYPVARGECRQLMYRIERDWSSRVDVIESRASLPQAVATARREVGDELIAVAPVFAEKPFFMSEEFSLADCCLCAILWRLPALGIVLPNIRQTRPLHDYMTRMFARDGFRASLSETEKEIRRR